MRRAVATFHDLFVMTGEYSSAEFRARFTAQARDAAARADAIIAVSEFTRRQVVDLLGVDASRVAVVHHGVPPLAYPPVARQKLVLGVGAVQKRKNTARMVEAFEALDGDWKLALAGSLGYGSEEVRARIDRSPARARISLLGFVPADELAAWYARASIFAFPSLDEGFGMPVLEAMAAGTPVITSNRSSLPEVAGGAALLVDPMRTGSIVEGLRELAQNEDLREDLARRGRARAALFTWDKAVRETWEVYRSLLPVG
jgi:glycosyltransferase involved in cell wall biosynthesis